MDVERKSFGLGVLIVLWRRESNFFLVFIGGGFMIYYLGGFVVVDYRRVGMKLENVV